VDSKTDFCKTARVPETANPSTANAVVPETV
jgi:hypothetical protein